MLDQKLAEAMQRILSRDEVRISLNATLERLIETGIGEKRGKSGYFHERDRQAMREWLTAKGFATIPVDTRDMSRAERLEVTPYEKARGAAVKSNRVSIKALAGQALLLGTQPIHLPDRAHLDIDWTMLERPAGEHRCIMVVENFECFNRIHQIRFDLPSEYHSPLVVYRGDPHESRIDQVLAFISEAKLPVLAFVDAGPAGVVIAARFPKLVGLITPDPDILDQQLASPQTGRRDLFTSQYPNARHFLDALPETSPCKPVWRLIARHRAGVVQERWLNGQVCSLFTGKTPFAGGGAHPVSPALAEAKQ